MSPRLVGIATGVCLGQVGHTACVGVRVLPVAPTGPAPVGVGPRSAALNAGLTRVGRDLIKNLGAAAALGWGQHQGRHASFCFGRHLGLRLQTTAALAEMLRRILTPGIRTQLGWNFISHSRPRTARDADEADGFVRSYLRWVLLKALRVRRGVGGMLRASRGCLEASLKGLAKASW